jgi:hypothetical protein
MRIRAKPTTFLILTTAAVSEGRCAPGNEDGSFWSGLPQRLKFVLRFSPASNFKLDAITESHLEADFE